MSDLPEPRSISSNDLLRPGINAIPETDIIADNIPKALRIDAQSANMGIEEFRKYQEGLRAEHAQKEAARILAAAQLEQQPPQPPQVPQ